MITFYRFSILTLVVVFFASACNAVGGPGSTITSAAPAATAAAGAESDADQPTQTLADSATSSESTGENAVAPSNEDVLGDTFDLRSITSDPHELSTSSFRSYRLRAQWVVEPKEVGGTLLLEVTHISDPLAEEWSFSDLEQGISSGMKRIDNRLWMASGGQWTEVSTEDISSFNYVLSALDAAVPDIAGNARLVGDEEINGVATRHYTFDESVLGSSVGAFGSINGDVWVSVDENIVIKFSFDAEDDQATFQWRWEVYDINASFSIVPPPGA